MQGQRLSEGNRGRYAGVQVPPERDYFGVPLDGMENVERFQLVPTGGDTLYRVSYLYLLVWGNDGDENLTSTDYGGTQLRAQTYLWLDRDEPAPTQRMQKALQLTAHRAAHLFDSDILERIYGMQSEWGAGYLTGFNAVELGAAYHNWEMEPVSSAEAGLPGSITWTTEMYLEVDGRDYAHLSGKASGTANPWTVRTFEEDGQEAVHVPPHTWKLDKYDSRPDYYEMRPPARSGARERYREGAGAGKDVYVNGKLAGELDNAGRAWLRTEYDTQNGKWGDRHSRASIVEETDATWQALRKGGNLYQTGETESAVYLSTSRAVPDGYQATDPDGVPVDLEVQEGQPAVTRYVLGLERPDSNPTPINVHADREIIRHMGYHNPDPSRTFRVEDTYQYPGFRPFVEYGPDPSDVAASGGDDDDGPPGQAGLDNFGGGRR